MSKPIKAKYLFLIFLISLSLILGGCFVKKVAPGAPSNLIAIVISYSQIDLTWQDNSTDETGFYIYRKTTDSYSNIGNIEANTTFYNDTGLSAGTTYSYKLTAYNNGGESESSNEVTITTLGEPTAPSAPSNLVGQAVSFSEIGLTWQDNSTNEEGFYVYRKTTDDYSIIATMETNATSYNNTNLIPEIAYSYKITAYNDVGESGFSNALCVHTPAEPLEAPSNVMAEAVSYKEINLTWQDNSDDEDHFRIDSDFGLGPGNNQFLVNVPANATHYEDCDLQPMREYKYFVMAERAGERACSERFWATTPNPITTTIPFVTLTPTGKFAGVNIGFQYIWDDSWTPPSETDPCLIKVSISVYEGSPNDGGNLTGSFQGVFELYKLVFASGWWWTNVTVSIARRFTPLYATIEITDVEIIY